MVRLQIVAVKTDLHNFFFHKGLQKLDNSADPPSWCIPSQNCPVRGFSGNRLIQAFYTSHHIRTGSLMLGIMRRIRRLPYLSSSLSPSGKLPVRIDGNFFFGGGGGGGGLFGLIFAGYVSLASQNCRLCSARSMAVLSDALDHQTKTAMPRRPLLWLPSLQITFVGYSSQAVCVTRFDQSECVICRVIFALGKSCFQRYTW